jgi:hypothetical protein
VITVRLGLVNAAQFLTLRFILIGSTQMGCDDPDGPGHAPQYLDVSQHFMTTHIPDDFEVGLADVKMHYDYIVTKMSRLKSLNNAPTALMAALDNEMLLAQNHIKMLTLISDIGGEVKLACIRSIILGKQKSAIR